MAEQDDQDMTGLPIHVRVKAQAAKEQDAMLVEAAEQRKRQLQATPTLDASEPTPQDGTQPTNQEPTVETQADAMRPGAAGAEDCVAPRVHCHWCVAGGWHWRRNSRSRRSGRRPESAPRL